MAMPTREIRSTDWAELCDRFTRQNRESLVTIEVIGADRLVKTVAEELPLQKMEFRNDAECSNTILIELESPERRQICHTVAEPIHMKIQEDERGTKILRIEGEEGATLVKFHSGTPGKLFQGLDLV